MLTFRALFGKDRDKSLVLGYRHLAFEFDQGTGGITERDIEFSGPGVGFGFSF